ncbi:hypothetical protein CFD26_108090 [Aspergillus turcosus]|uniref:Urea active transporter n=1 Tax=Aspergillus turcosus TaxID=1245748 RepID=A0A421DC67_9EURO|nr:hypothetical protein CFD26_108090 [Aspergillus turcosus]
MPSEEVKFVAPLSQGFGYGIIIGLGFAFALVMIFITWALRRYQHEVQTSEMFSTAGRSVKSGLVAAAVVSSWTWAATLLQSSAVAYQYGVSGPFFYASGATVQIILFATLAIELKRRAPNAHTFLEALRARYGTAVHLVFIVFCLMTNILVTAMLLTGGSAVMTSLTGVHTAAACFLLPIGVVLYTIFGGIKATFITDYMHTVVIIVVIFIFAFSAYATNAELGSPGKVYDALVAASELHPVEGNARGSYLTMRSKEGGIFWVINLVGNFGTVFLDNGYYNKAIAASPVHAFPGYVIGGLCWFAIPWLCATTMGLSALALEGAQRISSNDVTAGLVLPFAAVKLLGYSGAVCTTLMVFMAVTSAFSAQLIAVSSIVTYDVYQAYINPAAKVLGLAVSLIAWLVTAKKEYGVLTVASTGANYPMLAGNVAALLSPIIFSPVLTYVFGTQNYDYESMGSIRKVDDTDVAAAAHVDIELIPGEVDVRDAQAEEEEQRKLNKAAFYSRTLTIGMVICFLLLWPIPMYGSKYVFSKKFFTGWVVVGIIWLFCTTFGVVIFPLWEGRQSIIRVVRLMVLDLKGKRPALVGQKSREHEDTPSGVATPTEKIEPKTGA